MKEYMNTTWLAGATSRKKEAQDDVETYGR